MFFLLRSAVCIGLVVCALPDGARPPSVPVALSGVSALCEAAPARCLALLREGLKAGSGEAPAAVAAPSRDTLLPTDRLPAWRGSAIASNG